MSLEQVEGLRRMLLARRGETPGIAERRARFEAQMDAVPLPPDVRFSPAELGGMWVDAPNSRADRIVLWLHGGAFVLGSAQSYRGLGAGIARASGCRVLLLDYPLAPEHLFPAALDATIAALDQVMATGVRVAIGGDSAGGNLAVGAVQARLNAGKAAPAAVWLISPYLDLTHSGGTVTTRAHLDPFVDPATMPMTAATYLGDHDPADPCASPLFGTVEGFPPTLIQVGSDEVLFDDSRHFADRLPACVFQQWVGMIHVWPLFAGRIDEAEWAIAQGGAFLQREIL